MALDENKPANGHAHRDVLVTDDAGIVVGKVTMADIFRCLEPNYSKLSSAHKESDTLSKEFIAKVFEEFGLWPNPLENACSFAAGTPVEKFMQTPDENELVDEEDQLERAVHMYITGVRQPLIVRKEGKVTGVLRFSDVFEVLRERVLAC